MISKCSNFGQKTIKNLWNIKIKKTIFSKWPQNVDTLGYIAKTDVFQCDYNSLRIKQIEEEGKYMT